MNSLWGALALMLMFSFSACSPVDTSTPTKVENTVFCVIDQSTGVEAAFDQCEHALLEGSLRLFASQPEMPEETPLELVVELPEDWQILGAELSGDSMYMGRIPLAFQKSTVAPIVPRENAQVWHAPLRLGACVTDSMRWRLAITVANGLGQQESLDVTFVATRR